MYALKFDEFKRSEIIHLFEPDASMLVESTANKVTITDGNDTTQFSIPVSSIGRRLLKTMRLTRRALRLDKSNVVLSRDRDAAIVVYQSGIYRYDRKGATVRQVGKLEMCRNVPHGGVCVAPNGYIYIGEYGSNPRREPVPIWCSKDGGKSWSVIYKFAANTIRHVHGVFFDPVSAKLWIPTGDYADECYLFSADLNFSTVERHGDGSQRWRHVSCFFEQDHIVWGMDSQLETSYLQTFDRDSGTLTQGCAFPGPVWYSKRLMDGYYLLQTTCETGPGVKTDYAHIFMSKDAQNWVEAARYKKDALSKKYFKYGILAFADGEQSSAAFAVHGEALKRLDGKAMIASLQNGSARESA